MGFLQGMVQGGAQAGALPDDIEVKAFRRRPPEDSVVLPEYRDAPATPQQVDPNAPSIVDMRALLFNAEEARKASMAKAMGQDYEPEYQYEVGKDFKANPNLQFGTKGVARDIIGNAVDFLGSLVGRRPTYRDEKIRDKMYGWDQGPEAQAAAIKRVMDYDPQAGQEILKNLTAIETQRANAGATNEYKAAQSQQRYLQGISGIANGITEAPNPAKAYSLYRDTLQQQLNNAHGDAAPQLPPAYDEDVIRSLKSAGYGGREVASDMRSQRDNYTKQILQKENLIKKDEWEKLRAGTRIKVAEIMANSSLTRAQMLAEIRREIADARLYLTGEKEDLVEGTTTKSYSTAGEIRGNRTVVRTGKDANGNRVVQYSDGTVERK